MPEQASTVPAVPTGRGSADTDVVIDTARLRLRTWREEDIAPFVALSADPAVYDFLPGPWTEEKTRALLVSQNAQYARHGTCYFVSELRATGEVLGFVGLKYQDFAGMRAPAFAPCFELGWFLRRAHWGKGYAAEGAAACLRRGFDVLGLEAVVSFTVPDNLRSRAVMERLGMRRDPEGDFDHPALAPGHRLSRHVLYRIARSGLPEGA